MPSILDKGSDTSRFQAAAHGESQVQAFQWLSSCSCASQPFEPLVKPPAPLSQDWEGSIPTGLDEMFVDF